MHEPQWARAERQRPYDLIVYGATGFVGRLVAEYLAERYAHSELRWAIAGRSEKKLRQVQAELSGRFPGLGKVPILVADALDANELEPMVESASAVCSTVGPYAKYGAPLVAACVARQTHYADLTGEPQFIRRMIDQHHDSARARGVRIVHCCGFDSIPSDLGTYLLQQAVIERTGRPCDEIKFFLMAGQGGFSGGTVASLLNVLEDCSEPEVRRIVDDPYGLNPPGERTGPDGPDQLGPKHDSVTGWWTGPFVMAAVNTRVVRRSNALLGYLYGRNFRYTEVTKLGSGPLAALGAGALSGATAGLMGTLSWAPTRRLLSRSWLPGPGRGPSRRAMDAGHFRVVLSGRQGGGEVGRLSVLGHRDPGYGATSAMLGEAGACLALDHDVLESPGGVLTPASAFGRRLADRLHVHPEVDFELEAPLS